MKSVCDSLNNGVKWFVAIVMGTLVSMIFIQIVLRFFFGSSFVWVEELGRYMFVWLVFLGVSVGIYRGSQIAVTYFVDLLPAKLAGYARLAVHLLNAAFFGALIILGFEFAVKNFDVASLTLFIPMGHVYLILPISAVLCVLYSINCFIKEFKLLRN